MTELARLLLDHTDPLGAAILLGPDDPTSVAGGLAAAVGSLHGSRSTGAFWARLAGLTPAWKRLGITELDVRDFGAVGGGALNDTTAIQAACNAANGNVVLIPFVTGGFLTTGITLGTAKGLRIQGTLKTATNAPAVSLTADDQFVDGGGSIEGAGGGSGSQIGVDINGLLNFDIARLRFYNLSEAVHVQNTSGAYKGGRIAFCSAIGCTSGFDADTVGEYLALIGLLAEGCTSGFLVRGGNVLMVGCNGNNNTNGLVLETGANDSHGVAVGCNFNHNSSYAILTAAITNGFDFIGCHAYGAEIYLNGAQDVLFQGGIYSIVNWRLAAAAVARVLGALVLSANGDGVIVSADSILQFDESCKRAGGAGLPLARIVRGGYVLCSPPAAGQTFANAATTTILWSAAVADRIGNAYSIGAGPSPSTLAFVNATTGVITNRGFGGGKLDVRLLLKMTGVGATPNQLYMNIKKNGTTIHPFITSQTMVAGGTTYTIFNWSGRIQADVSDTLTFEIANNTGAAMTLVNSDTLLIIEGL